MVRIRSYFTTALPPTTVSFDKRAVKAIVRPWYPVKIDAMILNCLFYHWSQSKKLKTYCTSHIKHINDSCLTKTICFFFNSVPLVLWSYNYIFPRRNFLWDISIHSNTFFIMMKNGGGMPPPPHQFGPFHTIGNCISSYFLHFKRKAWNSFFLSTTDVFLAVEILQPYINRIRKLSLKERRLFVFVSPTRNF